MKIVRIAAVNMDNKVGAFEANATKMIQYLESSRQCKPNFVIFQEMTIPGYPCEDFVHWQRFNDKQFEQIERICEVNPEDTYTIFGASLGHNNLVYNCAVVLHGKEIIGIVPKNHLPEYGIFYDKRTFAAGFAGMNETLKCIPFGDLIFDTGQFKFAVEVCEDMWTPDGPMSRRAFNGAELIFNISASPFREGMYETRRNLVQMRSMDNIATLVYVNAFGGNDSLVFDGGGFVAQNGKIIQEFPRWQENQTLCEVDLSVCSRARATNSTWRSTINQHEKIATISCPLQRNISPSWKEPFPKYAYAPPEPMQDLLECLIVGLDGYMTKTKAFKSVALSLSGGRDSVLATIITYLWAQQKNLNPLEAIQCYSQPTRFNSETTKSIARDLSEGLGVAFVENSIEEAFARELEAISAMTNISLDKIDKITKQNCQARIRASRMWNISNATGALWIQTGNLSEKASGYSTIGGDLHGGYSLLGDVKKTKINKLLNWILENKLIPDAALVAVELMMATAASAELAEDQQDERDLMEFEILDEAYSLYAGLKMDPRDVWETMCLQFDEYSEEYLEICIKRFVRLFHRSVFKWVQAPEAIHTQDLDLDRERALQIPVVHDISWLDLDVPWIYKK